MAVTFGKNDSAIVRGIKTVGIGKKGSQSLDPELAEAILNDLKANSVDNIAKGAFFGALFLKGIDESEMVLDQAFEAGTLKDPVLLTEALFKTANDFVKNVCIRLLKGKTLNLEESIKVGQFLLSDEDQECAKGLIVSILRVRYETADEYEGLLRSFQDSIEPAFQAPPNTKETIIQLAEPFDGVGRSYLITPLVAKALQSENCKSVTLVGRNSGPKYGNNVLDVVEGLNIPCVKSNTEIEGDSPDFGFYINQDDLSKPLASWVERRQKTIKRPCFATLEKFLNPVNAEILITSAFHPPYGEKMTTVAERAGFHGSIVIRNGIEGSIAFPLKRAVRLLCSAKQMDGQYKRNEIILDPQEDFDINVSIEERLESPSLEENIRLIKQYAEDGKTDNELFDLRVQITVEGIKKGIHSLTQ